MKNMNLKEDLKEINPDALLADGFESAFIGYCERCGCPTLAAYDKDKCIDILRTRDNMEYNEAQEYLEFNVISAWMGPNTPCFITKE